MYKWLGIIPILVFPFNDTLAASFNCSKATTSNEKLICATPSLSELDETYADLYRRVKSKLPQFAYVKKEAIAALKQRASDCNEVECMEKWYRYRIFVYKNKLSNLISNSKNGELTISATEKTLDCDNDHTTIGMNRCFSRKVAEAREVMNGYYSSSIDRYSHDNKVTGALQNAQSSWLEYVKSQCNEVWNVWRDGSIRNIMYSSCELDLVQSRTQVLWQSMLVYADSTPSFLPEPFPVNASYY